MTAAGMLHSVPMWKIFSVFWPKKRKEEETCERLHGQRGEYVRFPKNANELDEIYGPVMRELSKH